MLGEERRSRLLEIVKDHQFASLPQLVDLLGVSESTIRRDLELLEEQGITRRIHGGVLYVGLGDRQFRSSKTASRPNGS